LVTYIAPGFVARAAWRARYPAAETPAGETLVVSAVMSLPLVALVQALIPGRQEPEELGYVAALLGVAAVVGYAGAYLRGRRFIRELLALVGYQLDPAGSIYSQTLALMGKDESVVLELQDGRRIWGSPRKGPQHKDRPRSRILSDSRRIAQAGRQSFTCVAASRSVGCAIPDHRSANSSAGTTESSRHTEKLLVIRQSQSARLWPVPARTCRCWTSSSSRPSSLALSSANVTVDGAGPALSQLTSPAGGIAERSVVNVSLPCRTDTTGQPFLGPAACVGPDRIQTCFARMHVGTNLAPCPKT
jgi:hypothetical protein